MISSVPPNMKGLESKQDLPAKSKKSKSSKRAQKRKSKQDAQDAEEQELESLLFGGSIQNYEKTMLTVVDDDDEEISGSGVDGEPEYHEEQFDEDFDEHGIMVDRSSRSLPSLQNTDAQEDVAAIVADKIVATRTTGRVTKVEKLKSVWVDLEEEQDDSDNSNNKISLISTQRLKKLRTSHDQTSVDKKEYVTKLRARHEYSTSVSTSWAKVDEHQHEDKLLKEQHDEIDQAMSASAYQLLSNSAAPLTILGMDGISSSTIALPAQIIRMERQPDANLMEPSKSTVQVVKFHPRNSNVLFTAGMDKTLRFFQIDGKTNHKVHGIHLPDMPIISASYLGPQGSVVVLSGRRSYFYVCDVSSGNITKIPSIMHRSEKSLEKMITSPCGKYIVFMGNDGHAILVDGHTRQLACTIKMNGSCRAVSFSPCSKYLFSSGSDGDIYQWDVRKTSCSIPLCVRRISNEDGTIVQALALSDQFLAVGAESGVVNMFRSPCGVEPNSDFKESFSSSLSTRPAAPLKRLMNLHTSASGLKFNHDGQILAMWSRYENGVGSLKLVHTGSQSVFANWPTNKTPLGYVWSLDFSPNSEYMAIGNDKGKCLLYCLRHYAE